MNKPLQQKLKDDVERVKQHAFVVIKISDEGKLEFSINKVKARLQVMAIIGTVEKYGEVILCEIGFGSTRPYSRCLGTHRRLVEESEIPRRRKAFSLSSVRYELVAPFIFDLLKMAAYERVSSWKNSHLSDNPFMVEASKNRWSGRRMSVTEFYEKVIRTAGIRFNVSTKDIFLLRDIYWADMHSNGKIINGLVRFINMILHRPHKSSLSKERILKLNGIRDIRRIINRHSLPRHWRIEVVRKLRDVKRNIDWDYVAEMIKWDGNDSEERKLTKEVLPNPESRVIDIWLKVTMGLEAQKGYVTFEVIPQKK